MKKPNIIGIIGLLLVVAGTMVEGKEVIEKYSADTRGFGNVKAELRDFSEGNQKNGRLNACS